MRKKMVNFSFLLFFFSGGVGEWGGEWWGGGVIQGFVTKSNS